MTRPLIDSRLGKSLQHFYPTLATIQTATFARGTAGSKVATWADDATRTDLPCAFAPTGGAEMERPDQTLTKATHRLGFRDALVAETGERVVVDDVVYDILLVETDSRGHATYLNLELVS